MSRSSTLALALAVAAGFTTGWLDVGATEVQGPLLLIMLAAFIVALFSEAPAWLIALAVALGLPAAHLVSRATGGGGDAQWGMLIVAVPALLASYGGRAAHSVLRAASGTLAPSDSPPNSDDMRAWHRRAASPAFLLGAALLGCALVGAVPVYATSVARGQPFAWWLAIVWQIVSFLAWIAAAPLVLRNSRAMQRGDSTGVTPRELLSHCVIVGGMALLHAVTLPLLTRVLFIPLGADGLSGAATWAFAAYLPLDTLTYCLVVGLGYASDAERRMRGASVREAATRGELAASRLGSLRAQLRPHFLFNALNAATVLSRRGDAEGAARVLTGMGDLLRYVLRRADDASGDALDDVERLRDELAFCESYLAVERERFPDRLSTASEITTDAAEAFVPHLLLQPLVENAVRHGIGKKLGAGTVSIRAWRIANVLHVSIEDDGPGPGPHEPTRESPGIGLANTRSRLETLYGGDAALELSARPGGGTSAHVTLPYRA